MGLLKVVEWIWGFSGLCGNPKPRPRKSNLGGRFESLVRQTLRCMHPSLRALLAVGVC